MITCISCGTENQPEAQFCQQCGKPLSATAATSIADPTPLHPAPRAAHPPAPLSYQYAPRPPKDRSIALILEILPGLFGLLGIGWIYAGNTTAGVIWLVAYLFWNVIAVILDGVTLGIFLCVHAPINIACLVLSPVFLHGYTRQHPELFGA